jgi:hypothetical protein
MAAQGSTSAGASGRSSNAIARTAGSTNGLIQRGAPTRRSGADRGGCRPDRPESASRRWSAARAAPDGRPPGGPPAPPSGPRSGGRPRPCRVASPSGRPQRERQGRSAGIFRGRRMVLGGRASVRTALYMPTLTAIRHNPALQAFYQRLIGRGRPAKVAITACMRKLLVILNAILREHRPWQTPWPTTQSLSRRPGHRTRARRSDRSGGCGSPGRTARREPDRAVAP